MPPMASTPFGIQISQEGKCSEMASRGCLASAPVCAPAPSRVCRHAASGVLRVRSQASALKSSDAARLTGRCQVTALKPSRSHTAQRRSALCVSASASAAVSTSPPAEPPFKWGADMKNLGICVAVAVAVWFCPPPTGVTTQAWHLLAIFLGTIVGIITQPLPLGAVAMLGLGATMLTKVLTFSAAFSAFASEIP